MAPEKMRALRNDERGSLTLVALCFTAIIAIALSSYIAICYRSVDLSTRDLHNKNARNLAEIGLEEGLWSLNQSDWSTNGAWSGATDKTFTFTGYALGQGATGQVVVTVASYAGNTPTITAVATVTLLDGRTFNKTLTASTKPAPLFGNAVATTSGSVTFNNNGTVDSWDSTLGAYGGANIGAAAMLAGTDVTITNATVKGYAATFGHTVSIASGTVRSASVATHDPNRLGQSAFIPTFTVTTPTSGTTSPNGLLTGGSQTIGVSGGATQYWYTSYSGSTDLTLGSGGTLTINGPVKIIVTGNLNLASTDRISITNNATARAEIYVAGNVSIANSSNTRGLRNLTSNPKKLVIFCTKTTGTFTCSAATGSTIYGVFYSASTSSPLNFTTDILFYGAILAQNNVVFSSASPTIHYDVALRTLAPGWFSNVSTPYVITQLTES